MPLTHAVVHAATHATAFFTGAATAVEHGERAAEARNDDLGRVALPAALVGPLAGGELAFEDKPWRPSSGTSGRPRPSLSLKMTTRCHSVRLLALPALAIAPGLRRRYRQAYQRSAVLHVDLLLPGRTLGCR